MGEKKSAVNRPMNPQQRDAVCYIPCSAELYANGSDRTSAQSCNYMAYTVVCINQTISDRVAGTDKFHSIRQRKATIGKHQ